MPHVLPSAPPRRPSADVAPSHNRVLTIPSPIHRIPSWILCCHQIPIRLNPIRRLITVARKGTGELQQLPAFT
jgi:hypothetical protein